MTRSIRGLLSLWLALLIALCMAAFALFLYLAVTTALTNTLDQTLRAQARQVAASYDFGLPDAGNCAGGQQGGQQVDSSAIDQFSAGGLIVETFDRKGRLLARSSNAGRRSIPLPRPAAVLTTMAPSLTTQSSASGPLRVYTLPATHCGQREGLVVLAAPLTPVTTTAHTLLVLLAAGGVIATLLTALGSSLVVRRGLRPIEQMAAVAERITARRLDQRLAMGDSPREVQRLARTFDAMLERLHESFAAQRRFVADAAHELRTPLATIHGRSEVMLLDRELAPETRDGLALLRDEAARLSRLAANLLLLARGDEDRALLRQPIELDVLLLDVARQTQTLARGVAVSLSRVDQALVLGDADLIKQLVLNLTDNALAYTPAGGRVTLSLTVAEGEARLAVGDSGPGIAPDELERIFERFYRPDQARSRRSGGAGLGLAIARQIADAHGGRIEVESTVGEGSIFTVVLPLASHF